MEPKSSNRGQLEFSAGTLEANLMEKLDATKGGIFREQGETIV